MKSFTFDNSFVRDLPGDPEVSPRRRQVHGALFSRVTPTPVAAPRLVAYAPEVAALLGIDPAWTQTQEFAEVFSGNRPLDGMQPYAANYGGHQFGNWAGQLGDGRAITLGETLNAARQRWELQLKGAGPTPYSRGADGRAVLRSSVREFLCSEAMHHLGVPTTRALSLVLTGDDVVRDMFYDGNAAPEPGAIVCRVAPSFIRFGNFELPASRGEEALLKQLVDYTIRRDFSELLTGEAIDDSGRAAWIMEVARRTAVMVAHWMRVGFVHGVMNTDNMSILGLTIDYGPYGWVDNFDLNWTPNTTDREQRRYRFGQQPQIAYWNLNRLANALVPAFATPDPLHAALDHYVETFDATHRRMIGAKLGLLEVGEDDVDLMEALQKLLQDNEVDMTLFFRALSGFDPQAPSLAPFEESFYDPARRASAEPDFLAWFSRYATRLGRDAQALPERQAQMNAANPRYVLRNFMVQEAIDLAAGGDFSRVQQLLDVLRRPYADQPGMEQFARRRPEWARHKAGCSMLSCSS